jgi:hypothetical protein
MRDAVVVSGWTWEAHNVPERLALALAHQEDAFFIVNARYLYFDIRLAN